MVNVLLKTDPSPRQGHLSPRYARGFFALAAITALMLAVPRVSSAEPVQDSDPAPGECVWSGAEASWLCNINGKLYLCPNNHPKSPGECAVWGLRPNRPVDSPGNVFVPPTNAGTAALPSTSTGTSTSTLTNRAGSSAASSTLIK